MPEDEKEKKVLDLGMCKVFRVIYSYIYTPTAGRVWKWNMVRSVAGR
jgi:hypothetical protein